MAFREECGNSVVIPSDCVCHYDDIGEVASSADLAGDVTVGLTSLANPVRAYSHQRRVFFLLRKICCGYIKTQYI